jgi:hypothetical protein
MSLSSMKYPRAIRRKQIQGANSKRQAARGVAAAELDAAQMLCRHSLKFGVTFLASPVLVLRTLFRHPWGYPDSSQLGQQHGNIIGVDLVACQKAAAVLLLRSACVRLIGIERARPSPRGP